MAVKKEKETLNVFQKLAKLRTMVWVKKTWYNNFSKFPYFELSEIYEKSKWPMEELGLVTLFTSKRFIAVKESEEEWVVTKMNRVTNDVEATLALFNVDNPAEKMIFEIDSWMCTMKWVQAPQDAWGTRTYLEKYLYMDMLMIDDNEVDPDSKKMDNVVEKATTPAPKKVTKKVTKRVTKKVTEPSTSVDITKTTPQELVDLYQIELSSSGEVIENTKDLQLWLKAQSEFEWLDMKSTDANDKDRQTLLKSVFWIMLKDLKLNSK